MAYRAILHDPDVYPDPLIFSPERFSDQKRNHELGINKLPWPAFGFGRRFVTKYFVWPKWLTSFRMCPGRWLAYESVWFSIACILSVYSIERGIDENGLEIVPEVVYTSSMIRFAALFLSEDELLTDMNKPAQALQMSLYTSFGKSWSVNQGYCLLSYAHQWEV